MLFFSFTGITLNHPTWFGGESGHSSAVNGQLPSEWLTPPDPDKLKIAEHLRASHRLLGKVVEFRIEDEECMISFRGPGYVADVFLERTTGRYDISMVQNGVIGKWNDLHKGRDSGFAWSTVIDISAIITIISATTGLVMLFFLKRKRVSGTLSAILGGLTFALFYFFFVPS